MSTKTCSCLIILVLMAAVASPAAAAPAYLGYTGLMLTPTADVLKTAGFSLGGYFVNDDDTDHDTTFVSANFGVLDSLEVGATLVSPDEGDDEVIFNGKFALLKETLTAPAVSVGVSDLSDELDATPYIVVSKSLPLEGLMWSPRLHVGLGGGLLDGVFAGVSAPVTSQLQLMAEYDTENFNFGLQFAAAKGLRLHAGLLDAEDLGLGLSYNVGF